MILSAHARKPSLPLEIISASSTAVSENHQNLKFSLNVFGNAIFQLRIIPRQPMVTESLPSTIKIDSLGEVTREIIVPVSSINEYNVILTAKMSNGTKLAKEDLYTVTEDKTFVKIVKSPAKSTTIKIRGFQKANVRK
jgi:hypothetical protein